MKKIFLVWLLSAILVFGAGCQTSADHDKPADDPLPAEDRITLAGIGLGDSREMVKEKLGSDYQSEILDDGGFFGEATERWTYGDEVELIIGEETGKVLQMKLSSPEFAVSSGARVGDRADQVLPGYEAEYPLARDHFEGHELPGWFVVEEGVWLIFDFKDDDTWGNQTIENEDQIVSIHLAYERFID